MKRDLPSTFCCQSTDIRSGALVITSFSTLFSLLVTLAALKHVGSYTLSSGMLPFSYGLFSFIVGVIGLVGITQNRLRLVNFFYCAYSWLDTLIFFVASIAFPVISFTVALPNMKKACFQNREYESLCLAKADHLKKFMAVLSCIGVVALIFKIWFAREIGRYRSYFQVTEKYAEKQGNILK
jgi:hypothetical protein